MDYDDLSQYLQEKKYLKSTKENFTSDYLKSILEYNPETGVFKWKVSLAKCTHPRDVAGTIQLRGRRTIGINKRIYLSSRLAWLYMTGNWPPHIVDHRNRDNSDDRWSNLRAATNKQNAQNRNKPFTNTSGFKGISWERKRNRWKAIIEVNYKAIQLGSFSTREEAYAAYCETARTIHGEFSSV